MLSTLIDLFNGQATFFDVVIRALSLLILIFAVFPMHNFAQSKAAEKLGDRTSKNQGSQTLNPFAHIDYPGALTMIIFGIGWGRPTIINHRNFNNPKTGIAIVAVAGVMANLLYALLFMLIGNIVLYVLIGALGLYWNILVYIVQLLYLAAQVCISITVFYLLPIPPLDGAKILSAILPDRYYYKYLSLERYFSLILLIIIATDVLDRPMGLAMNAIYGLLSRLAYLPFSFI